MFKWKVARAVRDNLEECLNDWQAEGWEIFNVIPTLSFVNTKIVMGVSAPLPQNVEYDIILRKKGES
jgi:hypothetical protein